jgi:hypothetical protein
VGVGNECVVGGILVWTCEYVCVACVCVGGCVGGCVLYVGVG